MSVDMELGQAFSREEREEAAPLIKVLVVEDSAVVREFLISVLNAAPGMRVVGIACDGEEALDAVRRYRPDVITMDIHMPRMSGLEATRRIMETDPIPIVIVSGSHDPSEMVTTFAAMEAGALALLPCPACFGHADFEATANELVRTVRLMAEVKVVRRWPRVRRDLNSHRRTEHGPERGSSKSRIVAIGASTGGPPVLHTILAELPKAFPLPILIVQHMASGFIQGFVGWLAQATRLPVHVGSHGEHLLPGHVYVAPDAHQMKVGRHGVIVLSKDPPENGLRPSVSALFRSVAEVYGGDSIAGLLTGMGRDGAEELLLLRERGAVTFAQDKESSVVHGMPGEAIRIGGAIHVLSPDKMARTLTELANECNGNIAGG